MNLTPERQKKADELGLPWSYVQDMASVPEKDWELFENFQLESANRILQLEQTVETLREALDKICKHAPMFSPEPYDGDNHEDSWSNGYDTAVFNISTIAKQALAETEASHE